MRQRPTSPSHACGASPSLSAPQRRSGLGEGGLPETDGMAALTRTRPRFAEPSVIAEHRPDGVVHLRSGYALGPYPNAIGAWLAHWAEQAPTRSFLAQREAKGEWRRLTYG